MYLLIRKNCLQIFLSNVFKSQIFMWLMATLRVRKPRRHWNKSGCGFRRNRRRKKREKRAGRMQLFRRAFTSRICDRHLLYPPLYIPGTMLHPFYPLVSGLSPSNHHLNSRALLRRQRVPRGAPTHRFRPLADPRKASRGILFSYSLGSDSPDVA